MRSYLIRASVCRELKACVACYQVLPDDMFGAKECRLKFRQGILPRACLNPLTFTLDDLDSALTATWRRLEHFGASEALSPQRKHFHEDSARRSTGPDSKLF